MIYKPYGNTGKHVSAVGFGGMRFDTSRSNEENAELVRYACGKGINYFDTAPDYCDDQSEDIYGAGLQATCRANSSSPPRPCPTKFDTAEKARGRCEDRSSAWACRRSTSTTSGACARWSTTSWPCSRAASMKACCELQAGRPDRPHRLLLAPAGRRDPPASSRTARSRACCMGINILNFPYRWDGVAAA